jgi:hypothetical protein
MLKAKMIDRSALVSAYSYRDKISEDKDLKYLNEIKEKFPTLEMILSTDESEIEQISQHQYKCDVWKDCSSKTIIFANVGTRFGSPDYKARLVDVYNSIQTIRGILPDRTSSVIALNEHVLSLLAEDPKFALHEWSFEYTGHSLGGHMANIGATDMFIRAKNLQISTIVFDEIGAEKSIEKICLNNNFYIEELRIEFISIRAMANLVNEFQLQITKHIIYRLDFEKTDSSSIFEIEELYNQIIPKTCFSSLYKLFSPVLSCCTETLELTLSRYEKKVFERLFNQLEKDGLNTTYNKLQYCHKMFLENFLSKETKSVNGIDSNLYDIIERKITFPYDRDLLDKYQKKEKKIFIEKLDVSMKLHDGSYKLMSSQIIYDLIDKDPQGIPIALIKPEERYDFKTLSTSFFSSHKEESDCKYNNSDKSPFLIESLGEDGDSSIVIEMS